MDDRRALPRRPAPLVAVLAAPGGAGSATAVAVARSLAGSRGRRRRVVLADLTLDAPHRERHGLTRGGAGLADLVAAARFGAPPPSLVDEALAPSGRGYLVLPGLAHHRDWVAVGERSAAAVLAALRAHAGIVVAHIDRDLEGEADTGSFDIEDRNVLARTVAGAASLVIVAGGRGRRSGGATTEVVAAVERFGVPSRRILVLAGAGPRMSRRRLGRLLARRLTVPAPADPASPPATPQRIAPGTLGHWPPASDEAAQGVEGWITPRVPQQP